MKLLFGELEPVAFAAVSLTQDNPMKSKLNAVSHNSYRGPCVSREGMSDFKNKPRFILT